MMKKKACRPTYGIAKAYGFNPYAAVQPGTHRTKEAAIRRLHRLRKKSKLPIRWVVMVTRDCGKSWKKVR